MSKLSNFCSQYRGETVVYMITNPQGKVYVGVTTNLYKRLHSHSRCYKDVYHSNGLLRESVKEFGWEAHSVSILFHSKDISHKNAFLIEEKMIISYRSCRTDNPDRGLNSRKGNNDNTYLKIANPNKKTIYQYDMNTLELIDEYFSAHEAARQLNKSVKPISAAATGRNGYSYGYYWSYVKMDLYKKAS
jgi:hypothetical protein